MKLRLTEKESDRLKALLPKDATKRLSKQCKISERMVRYILAGANNDEHGVIEAAIALRDKQLKQIEQLKGKL
jgi:hypothetical protein